MKNHDQNLAHAFDSQAPLFERAPVQSDPVALKRLVHESNLRPGSKILDAGCGPGLVSEAFLDAGFRVMGVDLSGEMIARAVKRCAHHSARATFLQLSLFDQALDTESPFDAALSRYVVHHVIDPAAFLARQIALVRSGGVLIVNDHVADPDPSIAAHHAAIEVGRDKTHTRNLTGGELVNLFASAGLSEVRYTEEPFTLDFDEWFNRGTPGEAKEVVRERLLQGPTIRSFRPHRGDNDTVRIDCVRAIVRGVKP